jgi:limonene-1,2-epoxide hydrolase
LPWSAPDFDADTVMKEYLAQDSTVRVVDSQPFLSGPSAVAGAFRGYMPNGERVKVKFLFTYAKGPLVITHRTDTMFVSGRPDQHFDVVGIFLIRNDKIKEWTDYSLI